MESSSPCSVGSSECCFATCTHCWKLSVLMKAPLGSGLGEQQGKGRAFPLKIQLMNCCRIKAADGRSTHCNYLFFWWKLWIFFLNPLGTRLLPLHKENGNTGWKCIMRCKVLLCWWQQGWAGFESCTSSGNFYKHCGQWGVQPGQNLPMFTLFL